MENTSSLKQRFHEEQWSEQSKWTKSCTQCIFISRGESGMYCGNPNQTDEDLKQYVYAGFTCGLFDYERYTAKDFWML